MRIRVMLLLPLSQSQCQSQSFGHTVTFIIEMHAAAAYALPSTTAQGLGGCVLHSLAASTSLENNSSSSSRSPKLSCTRITFSLC
jgi:hypothetical protein